MIGILIYDDHKPRRESLQALVELSEKMQFLGAFPDCRNVVQEVAALKPDVVLMDIEMPHTDGLQGVALIKKDFPDVKIIMQTSFEDNYKIFESLKLGAEGYILKKASASTITDSIIEVYNGGASMTPSVALKVMKYFNNVQAEPQPTQLEDRMLSPKELEVLQHLSNGMSYKMVAEAMNIKYFTVNNHIKKIYNKLQVHSVGEAISIAIRKNIV
jgi:DNA-binding NarL/FixJ family response regulator